MINPSASPPPQVQRIFFVNRVYWPAEEATAQLLHDLVQHLHGPALHVTVVTGTPLATQPASTSPGDATGPRVMRMSAPPPAAGAGRRTGVLAKARAYAEFLVQARRCLREQLKAGDIVVAMTDPPLLGSILDSLARRRGARMWHYMQDVYPEVALAIAPWGPLTAGLKLLQPWRDRSWCQAERIVTLGTDMAALIARRGVPANRISIVPNWAPAGLQFNQAERERASWGCPAETFTAIYSGNLGRAHDLQGLVDVIAQTQHAPQVQFRIIGEGAQKSALQARVTREKLGNCRFLAPVQRSRLGASLAAADLHFVTMRSSCVGTVWPSKFYGIVAAGKPLVFIGPAAAEIAGLITKHQLGLAVTPANADQAAAFVIQLAADRALHAAFCERVAAYAETMPKAVDAALAWRKLIADHA